ncbi:MAG: ankyrin repeat domain-containing protein [Alphaproteobacteria bacterium]|nr:ankyrin repeat domain-containing protein [Alphaproteobacteria bacterium]
MASEREFTEINSNTVVIAQGEVKARDGIIWVDETTFALFNSISRSDYPSVVQHLDAGADVNAVLPLAQIFRTNEFFEKDTPLMAALSDSRYGSVEERKAIVRLLLERGADVNCTQDLDRRSPLYWACYFGWEDVVGDILERVPQCNQKQYVNLCDNDGFAALHAAVISGSKTIVHRLLELGADCKQKAYSEGVGYTPGAMAKTAGNRHEITEMIKRFKSSEVEQGR